MRSACQKLQERLDLVSTHNGYCEQDDIETLRDRYWLKQFQEIKDCEMIWRCENDDAPHMSHPYSLLEPTPFAATHQTFLLAFLFFLTFFILYQSGP
ncbi:Oidioi.mRNA.OKI2018_I69.chr2.g7612.t1.cds [Oikopleura dioica]|uniref:Oidioi.mRNA.OKI2018_I69.chr2.g7612.t1.cds n=1 Tax=Oikopleura dioica TaxID=34765 RepID=A0ABN7T772_OIKDI|nr:Oidioi.mRNA.OKI2018_I69.chr2.g7612.t1.cds [Oikopleura dioica]